jgi:hypothetical protein
MDTSQITSSPPVAEAEEPKTSRRTLLLVAGSGRSGTSLFSGLLQRLGFYVPQPEVPADDTNPRGFAESQWVVDFHSRWLRRAGVQPSDARPGAWSLVAETTLDERIVREVASWLGKHYHQADHIVIKDPRLLWFLPLWRRAAEKAGVAPKVASVLRHPAAVVESKQRSYGAWQGEVARTAGWINQMLFTERSTRGMPRVFVRYEDLLNDWPRVVGRAADVLDLSVVADAPTSKLRDAHAFLDQGLVRSRTDWPDDLGIPAAVHAQAQEVWELMTRLADEDRGALNDKLDAARAQYIDFYTEAEMIAHSSIMAAWQASPPMSRRAATSAVRLISKSVPQRYKHRIPPRWRTRILRILHRSPGPARPHA